MGPRALLGPKVGSAIGTLATCTQLARNLATPAPPTILRAQIFPIFARGGHSLESARRVRTICLQIARSRVTTAAPRARTKILLVPHGLPRASVRGTPGTCLRIVLLAALGESDRARGRDRRMA